jgi:hypothetical protein
MAEAVEVEVRMVRAVSRERHESVGVIPKIPKRSFEIRIVLSKADSWGCLELFLRMFQGREHVSRQNGESRNSPASFGKWRGRYGIKADDSARFVQVHVQVWDQDQAIHEINEGLFQEQREQREQRVLGGWSLLERIV